MNKTVGAVLLIAGCSIGTGMLGIPVVTGAAGFIPSVVLCCLAWAFMAATGLLLGKVTLSFPVPETNLISMTQESLGRCGKWSAGILFTFLFYAVMVAYTIAGGILIADFAFIFFGIDIPTIWTSTFLVFLLFLAISSGLRLVDSVNRYLMGGLALCYLLLVIFGGEHMQIERLVRRDWSASLIALPMLVISFGYHNLVPTLTHYLDKDARKLRKAILVGSALPLLVYIIWEAVIIGVIPFTETGEWMHAKGQGEIITQVLARACESDKVVGITRGFAFFAIATSFLPVAFSFLDFLRDGFHVGDTTKNRTLLGLVVLAPPLVIALTNPTIFLTALNYAGGCCALLLFAVLPALMAWKRKISNRAFLLTLIIISFAILIMTLWNEL